MDTSARQRGFEIRVFSLLSELPKAIEPHLPVYQLYRWKLGPSMWSSPTTKSLDPIIVTAIRVGFPGESHGPATCGLACNCPELEAWTTEASGLFACSLFACVSQTSRESVRGAPWSAANRLHGQRTGAFSWRPVLGLSRKTDQFRLDPTQNCAPGWWYDRV